MKRMMLTICVLFTGFILSGCSSHTCDRCGKTFTGSAYYISKEPPWILPPSAGPDGTEPRLSD